MNERVFFDTNILIYMHDRRFPEKQRIAAGLFEECFVERRGAISTQVLQEFFVAATKKSGLLTGVEAAEAVARYSELEGLVVVGPAHILEAVDIHLQERLSFWDSLILAAARSAGARLVYSEDLAHEGSYAGVRVENPFL